MTKQDYVPFYFHHAVWRRNGTQLHIGQESAYEGYHLGDVDSGRYERL